MSPTVGLIDDEAGVGHRFGGGSQGEVDEAAHLAGLFFVDEEERIEILDLGGEADGMAFEIEGLDLGHAAAACEQTLPDFRDGSAYAADEAYASDDDASLGVVLGVTPLLTGLLRHYYFAAF
jgi:hypothetical protein